jgi:hypothetical protein
VQKKFCFKWSQALRCALVQYRFQHLASLFYFFVIAL